MTRSLPSHLRYARLEAELPPEAKRTPSMLAAVRLKLARAAFGACAGANSGAGESGDDGGDSGASAMLGRRWR